MPELREVFEMTTKQIQPDLDAWREQEGRQRRANRNRRLGALAMVAIIAVVAAVLIARVPGGSSTQPAVPPSDPVRPYDPNAVPVATGFVDAFGDFDAGRVLKHLADDVVLRLDATSPEELPLLLSYWEAQGFEQIVTESCRVTASYAAGAVVRCPFNYHAIRSDEIGLGPYPGYWELTVRDGRIVIVGQDLDISTFSPQMWEPFADWVSTTYPKDFQVMYTDAGGNFALTRASIPLWEKRTKEYVRIVTAET